jgi:hypothetical protein
MKSMDQIRSNYAPVYCALYPSLCSIFQRNGYALAVHGSLARDFDLVAMPWVEEAKDPGEVIDDIRKDGFVMDVIGNPEIRFHGRIVYTLSIGFGECACDLSFMPIDGTG